MVAKPLSHTVLALLPLVLSDVAKLHSVGSSKTALQPTSLVQTTGLPCEDDPTFVDNWHGNKYKCLLPYSCRDWDGLACDEETADRCGITKTQLEMVKLACQHTCGNCPTSIRGDPIFHYGDSWCASARPNVPARWDWQYVTTVWDPEPSSSRAHRYKVDLPPGQLMPLISWAAGGHASRARAASRRNGTAG